MIPHLVLIGLPGSGKSTVGLIVASEFRVPFHDIDSLIVERTGRSVPDLFEAEGEDVFRVREAALVRELLAYSEPSVLAPGGGWASVPGNLDTATGRALSVYLDTPAGVAVARAVGSGARPILEPDPGVRMRALLEERRPFYERADHTVGAGDVRPSVVAARIAEVARTSGGW